jgi:hypothetical protein
LVGWSVGPHNEILQKEEDDEILQNLLASKTGYVEIALRLVWIILVVSQFHIYTLSLQHKKETSPLKSVITGFTCSPKRPENRFYMLFWGIWAPPKRSKKVYKSLQVGYMYVPMSKLENKPLTESSDPFF